jgi:transposase-like protein
VAEQRYQAVLAVISDGLSISQVASKVGVSRQTLHSGPRQPVATLTAAAITAAVPRSLRRRIEGADVITVGVPPTGMKSHLGY